MKNKGRAYRDVLILHVPDALQHPSPDGIAKVLGGSLGVDVPEVNGPIQRLVSVQAAKPIHAIHASELGSERQVRGHWRPEVALILHGREGSLSDERLGCGGLSSLCGRLLRLGDVGTSVLAVVDALPCPGGFRGKSVDDLHSQGVSTRPGNKRDRSNLCRNGDTEEVDETDVLVPDDLDLINQAEPAEIIPQLFFSRVLVQTTEVYIPAGVALLNCQSDLAGNRGGFSPTDLQLLSV